MSALKVFVSSTCYDLSQVRADLHEFISGFGYQPILSEYPSFPVDPDEDTVNNCIQNVETADVFILIIGGRYGSLVESGKSITNTEYIYARNKGIPIYVFIQRSIIGILDFWELNPDSDFSKYVDSTRVFEFVKEVRSKNKNWCWEFDKVQEIYVIVKIQLTHLFKKCLDLRYRLKKSPLPDFYAKLTPKAISILLKEDSLFEAHFFIQVLKDELSKFEDLRLDLKYRILTNSTRAIRNKRELADWLRLNVESITNQVQSLNRLFNHAYRDFYGLSGVPADLKGLYYVASSMAKIYKEISLWSIDIRSTMVEESYFLIRDTLADFPDKALEEMWKYPFDSIHKIEEAIKLYHLGVTSQPPIESTLTLTIDESKSAIFNSELAIIQNSL